MRFVFDHEVSRGLTGFFCSLCGLDDGSVSTSLYQRTKAFTVLRRLNARERLRRLSYDVDLSRFVENV